MRVIDQRGRIRMASISVTDEDYSYVERIPSGGSWRVADNLFQIYDITASAWRTLFVSGALTFEQIALGDADTSADETLVDCIYMEKGGEPNNWRVQGGNFQLWNPDSEYWYTIYAVGAAGVEQIVLSAGDNTPTVGVGYMLQDKAGQSWKIVSGNFCIWNLTQSAWQVPYVQFDPPQIRLGTP